MFAVEGHYRKKITMANLYKDQGCNDLSKYDMDVLCHKYSNPSKDIKLFGGGIDSDKLISDLESLKEETTLIAPKLRMFGYTEPNEYRRTDKFNYVELYNMGYKVITEVELMKLVKKRVREQLARMAKVDSIECKLLEQFMMGNLTYKQVIDGSKKGCAI